MILNKAIAAYVDILNANWPAVNGLEITSGQMSLTADWAQASWESIVEAVLTIESRRVWLVVYGDGADCHARSSRFSCPDELPTHQVCCVSSDCVALVDKLSGGAVPRMDDGYALDRFVSVDGGWYHERPPFNHALVEGGGIEYVIPLSRLDWRLRAINNME